jgi:hypothetical protein
MSAAVLGADEPRFRPSRTKATPASQASSTADTKSTIMALTSQRSRDPASAVSTPSDTASSPPTTEHDKVEQLESAFDVAYRKFYQRSDIPRDLLEVLQSYDVSAEKFIQITENKELAHYIVLEEGRIIFNEIPGSPHGEVQGTLKKMIARQLDGPLDDEVMFQCEDNGTSA